MSGPNATIEKYWAELNMALAVPRSELGNQVATRRAFPGNEGASASPSRKRSKKRPPITGTSGVNPTRACAVVNKDQRTIDHRYTVFEPKRSSRAPPGIWPITYAQAKAEKRYPICTDEI